MNSQFLINSSYNDHECNDFASEEVPGENAQDYFLDNNEETPAIPSKCHNPNTYVRDGHIIGPSDIANTMLFCSPSVLHY